MPAPRTLLLATALALATATTAFAQSAQVKRGDYLVNRVVMCGDCHSPRGDHGQPVPGRELMGAPVRSVPIHPVPNWPDKAPALRGLPSGYTQADMAKLLETGVKPNGSRPRPPMPPFRFDDEDAKAVAAYLAGLR